MRALTAFGRTPPFLLLFVLLASAVPLLSGPPATSSSLAPPPSAPAAWTPESGHSSHGAPAIRLSTLSLANARTPANLYSSPVWLAFDPAEKDFWVAALPSEVDVVNESARSILATVPVGAQPFAVAVDARTDTIFVTNSGTDNVTIISGATDRSIGSVSVGVLPMGAAFDSSDGELFVANSGSDNVSVVSESTLKVVASVDVGAHPLGVTYDAATDRIFVADQGSYSVSVISGANRTLLATVPVGTRPYGVCVDNATDNVYVTNEGSFNISVINATTFAEVASIGVPYTWTIDLQGIVYDSQTHQLAIGAGPLFVILLNASTESVASYVTVDPSGVAYDPLTGVICVTNTANRTFECLTTSFFDYWSGSWTALTFVETGLPSGSAWSVLNDTWVSTSTTTRILFGLQRFGCTLTCRFTIPPADGYLATPAQVNLTFNTSTPPAQVTVSFSPGPSRYLVRFSESGMPTRFGWSVWISPLGYVQGVGGTIEVALPNGSYSAGVYPAAGYLATPYYADFTVQGAALQKQFNFSQFLINFRITESGLAPGTGWYVNFTAGPTGFVLPQSGLLTGGYTYVSLMNGSFEYTVESADTQFTTPRNLSLDEINGAVRPTSASMVYFASPLYTVTFQTQGKPTGAWWSVTLDSTFENSTTAVLQFSARAGAHNFTVGAPVGFAASPSVGSVRVLRAPVTVKIDFASTRSYTVTFHESGLPQGTGWAVAIGSVLQSSLMSYVNFSERNGSYGYVVLAVSGYATNSSGLVSVNGTNVTVAIAFSTVTYPVIVVELGLPNGTRWNVTAANVFTGFQKTLSSTGNAVIFFLPNGTYMVSVTVPPGYSASLFNGTFTVAGGRTSGPTVHYALVGTNPKGGGSSSGSDLAALGPWVFASAAVVAGAIIVSAILGRPRPPSSAAAPQNAP